jgi:NitT/TauT family transport system substrate-binding protein
MEGIGMTKRALIQLAFVAALTIATNYQAAAQTAVQIRLDWSLNGLHAPIFLAREKGYFAKENLDVSIVEGQGSATVMQLVAQGQEQFGLIDYSTMIYGVAGGLPIVAIGRVVSNLLGVISHADAPIKSPEDLVGKVIAYAPSESSGIVMSALFANNGIDSTKVNVLNPATGAKSALFLQGRIDAMPGSLNVQPAQLEAQGAKVYYFRFADFGVGAMEQGLIVNRTFLAADPKSVRGFVKAVLRGYADAKTDVAGATDALIRAHPEQARYRAVLIKQLEVTLTGLETNRTKGKPMGVMAAEDWQDMEDVLRRFGNLKRDVPVSELFSNEYLPK